MSLSTQRMTSIGLVVIGACALLWTQFSGHGGPAKAAASLPVESALRPAQLSAQLGAEQDGYRIALAGHLRNYAHKESIDPAATKDPFMDPASWTVTMDATPQTMPDPIASDPITTDQLMLTAVLDSPHGAVARVNGHLLVVGNAVQLSGIGSVMLVEVGQDGRSALVQTEHGVIRITLEQTLQPIGR